MKLVLIPTKKPEQRWVNSEKVDQLAAEVVGSTLTLSSGHKLVTPMTAAELAKWIEMQRQCAVQLQIANLENWWRTR